MEKKSEMSESRIRFYVSFGVKSHIMSVTTYSSSLLAISDAFNEIVRILDIDIEIEVCVESVGRGSIISELVIFAKSVSLGDTVAILALITSTFFGVLGLMSRRKDINMINNNQFNLFNIEDGDNITVTINKDVEIKAKNIMNIENLQMIADVSSDENVKVFEKCNQNTVENLCKETAQNSKFKMCVTNLFRHLSSNSDEIDYIIFTGVFNGKQLSCKVPQSKFLELAIIEKKEKSTLGIIRAELERGDKNWQFRLSNGKTIFAPILDMTFYDKLDNGEYAISGRDTLEVILNVINEPHKLQNGKFKKRYEVLEVLKLVKG